MGQLTYNIDLSGAWAKVRRSEALIDGLRREIWEAGSPDPYTIPLRHRYDDASQAVVFEVDRMIAISDDWTLVLGDALHDLRSAINHLAWQLALKLYDGVVPTERRVISAIQYPIVREESQWDDNRNWRHMTADDTAIVKKRQPFLRPPGTIHELEWLMALNDEDKHQNILLLLAVPEYCDIVVPDPPAPFPLEQFIDCAPDMTRSGTAGPNPVDGYSATQFVDQVPQAGDEVVRFFVKPDGTAPDVDCPVHLEGHIHIGEAGDILKALDAIYAYVVNVLRDFGAAPPNVRFTLSRIPKNWPHRVVFDDRPPDVNVYPPSGREG